MPMLLYVDLYMCICVYVHMRCRCSQGGRPHYGGQSEKKRLKRHTIYYNGTLLLFFLFYPQEKLQLNQLLDRSSADVRGLKQVRDESVPYTTPYTYTHNISH